MILYIETNFIAGVAMGRDVHAEALLRVPSSGLIALPTVCFMEARSVYEDERRRRNSFENILDNQRSRLRRDLTSVHATALLHHLEQAYAENVDLLNEIQSRLRDVQEKLAGLQAGFPAAELLPLTPMALAADLATDLAAEPTKDPTDNLILAVIREHALQNPEEDKAFLSGNTRDFDTPEIRALLAGAGIPDYFARTDAFLGWLASRSQPR